jgi:manganese/zinc/iron transport system substrate-binding protein
MDWIISMNRCARAPNRGPARLSHASGLLLCLFIAVTGCQPNPDAKPAADRLKVTTTTTMVTDLVKQVGGEQVEVQALMGPGVDPHLYKASASDVTKFQRAEVIFYNGLLLEGKLQEVLTRLARNKKHVYAVSDGLPRERLLQMPGMVGHYDPHIWFDVPLWSACIDTVVNGLSAADPAHQELYRKRGTQAKDQMRALHDWAAKRIGELPQNKRVLITSHDAFSYFGRAYGFEVVGLQGISTVEEVALSSMVKMVEFIKARKVKAIFVESSVPHQSIDRISMDAGVQVGGELFSDATGAHGQMENGYDLGTYEGMIKHNINTIVDALK